MPKLFLFTLLFVSTAALGQTTVVKGKVTDFITGEPLTGVNVSIDSTGDGGSSNFEGRYSVKTNKSGDTVSFT